MLGLVAFRLVWGLIGTRHARFTEFVPTPAGLLAYLRELAAGSARRHLGHNPAGGAMILALLAMVALTAGSGALLVTDQLLGLGLGRGPAPGRRLAHAGADRLPRHGGRGQQRAAPREPGAGDADRAQAGGGVRRLAPARDRLGPCRRGWSSRCSSSYCRWRTPAPTRPTTRSGRARPARPGAPCRSRPSWTGSGSRRRAWCWASSSRRRGAGCSTRSRCCAPTGACGCSPTTPRPASAVAHREADEDGD